MKKVSFFIALAFAAICLSACSNTTAGTSDDPNQITASIKGVVEKGPFVKGTTVTLYELNPETFAQTGKVFTGSIDGDDGSFSLGKVELGSRYALVEASGYYWNELYGMKTTNPLSLKAVVHIEKNSTININVGTHITHKRILSLVESGMDFDKAKAKAESEVVEAFFGENTGLAFDDASIFDDDMLLALSIIVLMAGPEPDVTETIASLASGLTSEQLLKLVDKAAFRYTEYAYARKNMEKQFPNATVGHFEKYVYAFWQRVYGLGECSEKRSRALDTVKAENSVNAGNVVVCKEIVDGSGIYAWRIASDVDENTASFEPVEDGRLVYSEVDSSVAYVYDGGKWRQAYANEVTVGIGCVKTTDDSLVVMGRNAYRCNWNYCIETVNGYRSDGTLVMPDSTEFVCRWDNSPMWKSLKVEEFPKDYFFSKNVEYGTVTDERDGKVYRTVELAGKTWMAENLAYGNFGEDCSKDTVLGCFYYWRVAMNIRENDSIVIDDVHQGICMEGWHVPDSTEWATLLSEYELTGLKSEIGWTDGTNETGFSVVPTSSDCIPSEYRRPNVTYACSDFVVAGSREGDVPLSYNKKTHYGVRAAFDVDGSSIKTMAQISKSSSRGTKGSLRCVKDSE